MGGLWQALVFGFAGVRPRNGALIVHPVLPERWDALELRLFFRGHPLALRIDHDEVSLSGAGLVIGERDGAWEVKLQ
jgi:trehalose/maltose hydrolase-like predicted phosphorylase